MTKTTSRLQVAAALSAMLAAAGSAQAADDWQYELTPYLWASGMKGDVQAGRLPKTSVDMSFSDILDNLDFGLMGAFEARKGRWGLLFDGIYMKVSDSATASRSGPGPIGATASAHAEAQVEQTMLAGAVGYRVTEGQVPVDVIGGLRYTKIDVDAEINASLFALSGTVKRSGDLDWIDPYVGLRVQYPLNERWSLLGYADVGGFGVGSDFTWQGVAGVNYEFSKTIAAKFGYRYLRVDYDKDNTLYEMRNDGLYLGAGIRF
jgi:opacity protein-like surface antigen